MSIIIDARSKGDLKTAGTELSASRFCIPGLDWRKTRKDLTSH